MCDCFLIPKCHRVVLLICVAFSLVLPLCAELVSVKGNLTHDFGQVGRGERMKSEVVLRNDGKRTVSLKRVKKSCGGCLPISLSKEKVGLGETVSVFQRHKSGSKSGPDSRKYFVTGHDGATSTTLAIVAKWTVAPFIDCFPEEISFGKKLSDTPYSGKISLHADGLAGKLLVTSAKSSSTLIQFGKPQPHASGKRIDLPFSILPGLPIGAFASTITLRTNCAKEPRIELPVRGTVLGPFTLTQTYITFGIVAKGSAPVKTTEILCRPRGRYKVVAVECDEKIVEATLKMDRRGRSFIEAQIASSLPPGKFKTTIKIKTDSKMQPELTIPLMGLVR